MRTTRGMVYGAFVRFCEAAGKVNHDKVAAADRPYVGAWHLDYDPIGRDHLTKGWYIEQVTEDGRTYPMGMMRRSAHEMLYTMEFCIKLLQSMRIDNLVQRQYDKIQEAIAALKPDVDDVGEWMFKHRS